MKTLSNAEFENLVSNFCNKQYISVLSRNSYDVKFNYFYNYLLSQKDSVLITDIHSDHYYNNNKLVLPIINKSIVNMLEQIKDKSVFISVPVMEWDIADQSSGMHRSKIVSHLMRSFHGICCNNNLSLNLMTQSYNGVVGGYQRGGGSGIMYSSSFVVNYQNEEFEVIKDRYGYNRKYDINELPIMTKFYREKKLKRILS